MNYGLRIVVYQREVVGNFTWWIRTEPPMLNITKIFAPTFIIL